MAENGEIHITNLLSAL